MIMMMVMVVVSVIVVVMVMMMVMIILSHYNRPLFNHSSITALVLGAQNLLRIRDGIQQLGKRLGRL